MSLFLDLRRAQQALDRDLTARLPEGVTPRQAIILDAMLDQRRLDAQRHLVATLGIDRSTLTDVLRRLTKAGLLDRQRDKRDARALVVTLTVDGVRVAQICRDAMRAAEKDVDQHLALTSVEEARAALRTIATPAAPSVVT